MTPDLKTLRSVAEGATPGPWVAGTVPRPHAWDRAFVRVVTDLPDGGRITVYPAACESTTLDNAANAAFIAAANPQAILSLLDRVEALASSLETLRAYAVWQIEEGADHHPTLPSAVAAAVAALKDLPGAPQ